MKAYEIMSQNLRQTQINAATWSIYYNVKEHGAIGNGNTDDAPAISSLFNKIEGEATVIFPDGHYRIGSDLVVPENVVLYFVGGGILEPDEFVNIKINGGILAGPYRILGGKGNANGSKPIAREVLPQWWGAKGDGATDDTLAIKNTRDMASEGSTIMFLAGAYKVSDPALLTSPVGVRYLAEGYSSTFLYNGQIHAIPTFTLIASLGPDKVVGTDQSGALQTYNVSAEQLVKMDADVQVMNHRIDNIVSQSGNDNTEIVDARGGAPILGDRLNVFDEQLAETETNLTNIVNVIDEASDLNTELSSTINSNKAVVNEKKTLTTKLTNVKDKVLVGNGEMNKRSLSSVVENFFVDVKKYDNHFSGKVNKFDNYAILKRFTDAAKLGSAKVGIIGDSIDTMGGTYFSASYKNFDVGNAWSFAPNGLTESDSFIYRMVEMLTTNYKNTTFDIKNYAIAGSYIQQFEDDKTFSSVTKKWIDFLKDENVDIIFVGWGMNQSSFELARGCKYYLNKLLDYVATWTTPPLIVVSTTPRPVMEMSNAAYGTFAKQFSRHIASHAFRHVAEERGCYVLDLNYLHGCLKDGIDNERFYMATETPFFGGSSVGVDGVFTLNSGQNLNINNGVKDYIIEFDLEVADVTGMAATEFLDASLNLAVDGSTILMNSRMFIRPNNANDLCEITNYANISDATHYGAPTQVKTTARNNKMSIRIEKRNSELNVYVNRSRVIRDRLTLSDVAGYIELKSLIVNPCTISNIKLYKAKYMQYTPIMTDTDSWGEYSATDTSTKQPVGGNGVNHPSTILLEYVYNECLREFSQDLKIASI